MAATTWPKYQIVASNSSVRRSRNAALASGFSSEATGLEVEHEVRCQPGRSDVLEAAGGVKGKLKAVIVGGLSTPILTASECANLTLDYDSCAKAGTMLGSGGIIVMNDTVRIPSMALRAIQFYAHESCGQCAPSRQGAMVIEQGLHRIVGGKGSPEDVEDILGLCKTIKGSTLCPKGDAFAMPIEAMVQKFRAEFL
jgi:NADH:ubiquinone oxidoreductase subunit F (NADH-binding)